MASPAHHLGGIQVNEHLNIFGLWWAVIQHVLIFFFRADILCNIGCTVCRLTPIFSARLSDARTPFSQISTILYAPIDTQHTD